MSSGKCVLCKKEKELVGIGSFAKCCYSCQQRLVEGDLEALASKGNTMISNEEIELVRLVAQNCDWKKYSVERRSERPFDLSVKGQTTDCMFSAHLLRASIHALVNWWSPEVASKTCCPEITKAGDWSGVRDTEDDVLWEIFEKHVLMHIVWVGDKMMVTGPGHLTEQQAAEWVATYRKNNPKLPEKEIRTENTFRGASSANLG